MWLDLVRFGFAGKENAIGTHTPTTTTNTNKPNQLHSPNQMKTRPSACPSPATPSRICLLPPGPWCGGGGCGWSWTGKGSCLRRCGFGFGFRVLGDIGVCVVGCGFWDNDDGHDLTAPPHRKHQLGGTGRGDERQQEGAPKAPGGLPRRAPLPQPRECVRVCMWMCDVHVYVY